MRMPEWFSRVVKRPQAACRWMLVAWLSAYSCAASAGVMADRTRIILADGALEQSVQLVNVNDYPVMLQAWVDNGQGSQAPDTIVSSLFVMPAVVRLQPHEIRSVRVLYTGDALATEKESVFWLNLYEIPLLSDKNKDGNTPRVLLGINTQIKVFYRPTGLPASAASLAPALEFSIRREDAQWFVVCRNRSPYFASFAGMHIEAEGAQYPVRQLPDMMTPPMAERSYPIDADMANGFDKNGLRLEYTLIDDAGNLSVAAVELGADSSAPPINKKGLTP